MEDCVAKLADHPMSYFSTNFTLRYARVDFALHLLQYEEALHKTEEIGLFLHENRQFAQWPSYCRSDVLISSGTMQRHTTGQVVSQNLVPRPKSNALVTLYKKILQRPLGIDSMPDRSPQFPTFGQIARRNESVYSNRGICFDESTVNSLEARLLFEASRVFNQWLP